MLRTRKAIGDEGEIVIWYITNYADARRFLADTTVIKDDAATKMVFVGGECDTLPAPDPLESRRFEHLLRFLRSEVFGGAVMKSYRVTIVRIAHELLDRMPRDKPVDLIAEYALPLAIRFFSALYGLPPDHSEQFPRFDVAMHTGSTLEEVSTGGNGLYKTAIQLIELKRCEPADDLFTKLVRIHETREPDNPTDLAPLLVLLLDSAMDAAAAIGNGLFVLLTHHHQFARPATNPTQLADTVDELLRYEPPVTQITPRRSTRPFTLTDGTTIPAGELVIVSVAAANRDPAFILDPDRFDTSRDAKTHLAFGYGSHQCAGRQLARVMVEAALSTFIERYPDSRPACPPEELTWQVGKMTRRLGNLPVVLDHGDERS